MQETVFRNISNTEKNVENATQNICDELRGDWKYVETLSLMVDISSSRRSYSRDNTGPYLAGGSGGNCPRQENLISNIVFDFAGLFLVAILEFSPRRLKILGTAL